MSPSALVVAVAAFLLIVAGVSKVRDPAPTQGALRASGLPGSAWIVTGFGIAEIALAALVLTMGSQPALLAVGFVYGGFALFIVQARVRRLPIQSCGCFGTPDTAPTWLHAVGTAAMALVTMSVSSVAPGAALGASFDANGLTQLLLAVLVTYLLLVALVELPRVRAVMRARR